MTPAVRKILASQKTFANYLADEEAMSSSSSQSTVAQNAPTRTLSMTSNKVTKPSTLRGKRSSLSSAASAKKEASLKNVATPPAGTSPVATTPVSVPGAIKEDTDPLLRSYIPSAPPESVLEQLLRAPPLSYAAARADPPDSGVPSRHFCEICGYWGRIRCLRCGARVCGLECKGMHDEGRCLKFYA